MPRHHRMALGLGSGATLLSLLGSWIPSLWGDEAASAMSAERPLGSLFTMLTHVDAVHGTYYFGLHFWVALFGSSPFVLRLPSAIAVGFVVSAVYLLCRRLSNERIALAAAIICAVLPRTTYMGEEARSFAFSAAIAAWSTLVLIMLIQQRNHQRSLWIIYGILIAVGTYVFLYVALFVVVHLAILLSSRSAVAADPKFFHHWFVSAGAGLVASAPIIVLAIGERGQISYLAGQPQFGFTTLTESLWFGDALFATLAWSILILGLVLLVVQYVMSTSRSPRQNGEPLDATVMLPRLEIVGLAWLLIPAAALITFSLVDPIFTARYLSFCAPAAAILVALALHRITAGGAIFMVVAVALVVAVAAPVYLSQREPYSKNNSDWAEISAALAAEARPGDVVVFDESASPSHRPRLAMHTYPAGFVGLRDVTIKTPFPRSDTWYDRTYSIGVALARGRFDNVTVVWLIEYVPLGQVDTYGLAPLHAAGFQIVSQQAEHSSVIYKLVRP
ncbi:MAG: glycosyltransferase family 39 protein [Terrimesophilobacter sp.]